MQPLTIITKRSMLDVTAALDSSLQLLVHYSLALTLSWQRPLSYRNHSIDLFKSFLSMRIQWHRKLRGWRISLFLCHWHSCNHLIRLIEIIWKLIQQNSTYNLLLKLLTLYLLAEQIKLYYALSFTESVTLNSSIFHKQQSA